uniref:ERF family protein n=1 Tax=Gudongella sp. SC589 TaxID=3385990 RepID=UPI003904ADB5
YSERYFLLKCLGLPTDEDDPDAKETNSYEKKSSPPPAQTKNNGSGEKLASEKQLKYIYTLVEEKNYTKGIKAYIKNNYNKDSSKDLTATEASELIKLLQDMQA